MLAKKFTEFILAGNKRAILIALLCSLLPLLGWISAVVVAVVTLCKSVTDGFIVLLWAALPYVVMAVHTKSWALLLHAVVFGTLFVWILAALWRVSGRFVLVVESTVMLGILAVVTLHLLLPNPQLWWMQYITNHADKLINSVNINLDINWVKKVAAQAAPYMTGIQVVIISFAALLQLIIARVLQAGLGDLRLWRNEWYKLRLSRTRVLLLLVWLGFLWLNLPLMQDLLPVLIFPLLFAGISLAHSFIFMLQLSPMVSWMFYLLVFVSLLFMPYLLSILAVAAFLDSFLNFRARFSRGVS